ncbi:response regulator [Sphingomonas glacialis]|nr:response regulator transcription factor [Sphingomonas glacialis]
MAAIRILLADDHPVLRDGVCALIGTQPDMQIVAEAANGFEAVDRYTELRPDVALMDLQMPGMNGLAAIEAIRKVDPGARIVVLTTYSGDAQVLKALKAGAAAYLLKSALRNEMIGAIRSVHVGRRHIQTEVAHSIAEHAADESLNAREIEILRLIAEGDPNKAIALKMSLAEDTIKAHIRNIFTKLYVSDRTHAVTTAVRRGIIEL